MTKASAYRVMWALRILGSVIVFYAVWLEICGLRWALRGTHNPDGTFWPMMGYAVAGVCVDFVGMMALATGNAIWKVANEQAEGK